MHSIIISEKKSQPQNVVTYRIYTTAQDHLDRTDPTMEMPLRWNIKMLIIVLTSCVTLIPNQIRTDGRAHLQHFDFTLADHWMG